MAIGDITGTLDSLAIPADTGDPYILHCSGELYAIVYAHRNAAAGPITRISTVTISSAGDITSTGHSLDCDVGTCFPDKSIVPHMAHVSGNVYAITYARYEEFDYYFVLRTVTINGSTGAIAQTGHSWNFLTLGAVTLQRMPITHVSGDMYAIAYTDDDWDGWIKTTAINGSTGAITPTGHSLEFDNVEGEFIDIIHISGDMYAIAYTGPGHDGWIKTVTISDAGVMALTGHSLEFDNVNCQYPDIIHISGDMYAIAYVGPGAGFIEGGWIKTVTISDAGVMALTGESLEFYTNDVSFPCIAYVADDVYAIEYTGRTGPPTYDNKVVTITINSSTGAIALTGASYVFDNQQPQEDGGKSWEFIHVDGNTYVVVYPGSVDIKTIGIVTSEAASAARHRFTGGMMHRPVH